MTPSPRWSPVCATRSANISPGSPLLNRGESPSPPPNLAGTLALVNVEQPDHADWQPVLDLLGTPTAFIEAVERPLTVACGSSSGGWARPNAG